MDVELRRGKNQYKIWATDPDTGKQSEETAQVVITVPFAIVSNTSILWPGGYTGQPAALVRHLETFPADARL